MRWYSLTDQERRSCRAPLEIEGLGLLALTLFGRWEREALFVLVTAFVDESGTGGEPRLMLGAFAARAHHWHGFNRRWQKLLDREGVTFSHLYAMESRRHPFKDWGSARTRIFVRRAIPIIERYIDFGFTVSLSPEDYRDHYQANLPKRARSESRYGLCARILIESVIAEAVAAYGPDTVVNFVFEDSNNFESARLAFREMKDHIPSIAPNMGKIAPGEKDEFAGLQAADLSASLGRRAEPTAQFAEVVPGTHRRRRPNNRTPVFHVGLEQSRLLSACVQADAIATEKRYTKAQAKRAERG